ncbi:MAG TPA: permease prefix domain 1-containing protein, partial [Thermoanaerobaculia bacterium]|nr:permease prefix domain 1-containing protein [Thermoanaerobaculia bacterium]
MGDANQGRPRRPHGVRRLFRLPTARRRLGAEIDDELAFHLERRIEELIAEGMDPAAARREAERRFGDRAAVRRECRRIDGERETRRRVAETLGGWLGDVRLAARQLLRAPGFALLAIFTLALGIGAASAIYSVVHAVLLRSLPVDDPGRVVLV